MSQVTERARVEHRRVQLATHLEVEHDPEDCPPGLTAAELERVHTGLHGDHHPAPNHVHRSRAA
jgi:hypothetical protein